MERVNKKKTILERLSSSRYSRYDNHVLDRICNWKSNLREDFINKNDIWIECTESVYDRQTLKDEIVYLIVSYINKKLEFIDKYDVFDCEQTYFYDSFILNDDFLNSSCFENIVISEDSYYTVLNVLELEKLCNKFAKEFIRCYKTKKNFKD